MEQGIKMSQEIGAYGYGECSAKTGVALKEVLNLVVTSVLKIERSHSHSGNSCLLM